MMCGAVEEYCGMRSSGEDGVEARGSGEDGVEMWGREEAELMQGQGEKKPNREAGHELASV